MSGVWRQLLRSLKVRLVRPEKQYVGSDPLGNKYYRIPKHAAAGGGIIQERRGMEAVGIKEHEYESGNIPMEWEAWMKKKRKDPPTIEEILKNENYKEGMKKKVQDVYEKDRLLQAKEGEEGLVAGQLHTQIQGHASALPFGKQEPSEGPISTANTFQPGSWMPSKESPPKKGGNK